MGLGGSSENRAWHPSEKAKEMLEKTPWSEVAQGSKDREWTRVGGGDSEAEHPPVAGAYHDGVG